MSALGAAGRADEDSEEEDEDYVPVEDEPPQTAEEKEVIARRTRAQHSLKETAWEEIERWLNEQPPTPSPPATPAFDETQSLYADFLARLRDPGPAAAEEGAETDPGEDDFDFVPQDDAGKKREDDNELRNDRATMISKAELAALFGRELKPKRQRVRKTAPPVDRSRPPPPIVPKIEAPLPVLISGSALTDVQLDTVRSQVATHVQLLMQTYVMARREPATHYIAERQWGMLQALVHYRNLSEQLSLKVPLPGTNVRATRRTFRNRPSVLTTPLLGLVPQLPPPPIIATHKRPHSALTPPATSVAVTPAAAATPAASSAQESAKKDDHIYPELEKFTAHLDPRYAIKDRQIKEVEIRDLPRRAPTAARLTFKPADDAALLEGLRKHGRRWAAIQAEFLPKRTVEQVHNRFKYLCLPTAPTAAVREWVQNEMKPLTKEETAELNRLALLHGKNWELIARVAFPGRSVALLRKAYGKHTPPLLPMQHAPLDLSLPLSGHTGPLSHAFPQPLPLPLPPAPSAPVPLPLSTVLPEPPRRTVAEASTAVAVPDEFEIEELLSDDDTPSAHHSHRQTDAPRPLPLPSPQALPTQAHDAPRPLPLPPQLPAARDAPRPLPLPPPSSSLQPPPSRQRRVSAEAEFEVEELSDNELSDSEARTAPRPRHAPLTPASHAALPTTPGPSAAYAALPTTPGPSSSYSAVPTTPGPSTVYSALPTTPGPSTAYSALPTTPGPSSSYSAVPTTPGSSTVYSALPTTPGPSTVYSALPTTPGPSLPALPSTPGPSTVYSALPSTPGPAAYAALPTTPGPSLPALPSTPGPSLPTLPSTPGPVFAMPFTPGAPLTPAPHSVSPITPVTPVSASLPSSLHTTTTPDTPAPPLPLPLTLPPPPPAPLPLTLSASPSASPSGGADNVLQLNGRVVYWSRDEDRAILLSAPQGAGARRWAALAASGQVAGKTEAEIEQRYAQLCELQRARSK